MRDLGNTIGSSIRKLFLGIGVMAFVASGGGVAAAEAKIATAFVASPVSIVNTSTPGQQTVHAIGALADGGYTVAWLSQDGPAPGPGTGLFIQRHDASGAKQGAETRIPFSSESLPAVGVLDDGDVVVVYSATRPAPAAGPSFVTLGVYARRFDSGGAPVGGEAQVFSTVHDEAGSVLRRLDNLSVLTWEDGSYLAGWANRSGADAAGLLPVFQSRRYDEDGNAVGPPVTAANPAGVSVDARTVYRLTAIDDGGYLVSTSFQGRARLIQFTRYDDQHSAVGPQFGPLPEQSVVVPLDDGGFVLWSWHSNGAFSYYRLFDGSFNPVGPEIALSSLPFGPVSLPDAAQGLADGSFVGVWAVSAPDGSRQLQVQRFDGSARLLGSALPVPFGGALPVHLLGQRPLLAPLAGGGFAMAWTATGAGADVNVYARSMREAQAAAQPRKAQQSKTRLCKAQAKGRAIKGSARRAFIDSCTKS